MKYLKTALAIAATAIATTAMADVTFYQNENFTGPGITVQSDIRNFERIGFNDRASSVIVRGDRNARWEVCEDARYEGRCVVLRPGQYASIQGMGLNNRISSVREIPPAERIADTRYAPVYGPQVAVVPAYNYSRRPDERLYEVRVTDVRAVVGSPQQRCWIEREQVGSASNNSGPNVGGAVAGALIGGILGHQIGGGSGKDAATALGVVGGAAIGANSGGGYNNGVVTQDVQRCTTAVNQAPAYYDVSYMFEGREHRVQMATPPASSIILVNSAGEPRS
ncbi:glycine zipper 2TM domain-containing protein [Caenimonas koreensis DSM 17982]|uniref:Glycine zipper 2TM domain-containing protein n=1 Tax=Caenimonas koreensis DSM 17982 TaxID=1121255 RepID=A0A844B0E4_9BURK|nr:beta/gamma crystallin-related protein [Caenimonas koreensis]MRD49734.1 glycine zipper 2TM domain-containing protein [Caenimonas koreensis DSM 17982]